MSSDFDLTFSDLKMEELLMDLFFRFDFFSAAKTDGEKTKLFLILADALKTGEGNLESHVVGGEGSSDGLENLNGIKFYK